jgi:hypothetical protein
MTTINHRFVDTNGIKMHFVEQGQGPLSDCRKKYAYHSNWIAPCLL